MLITLLTLALSIASPVIPATTQPGPIDVSSEVIPKAELQMALRELWNGHVFWVRSYVIASHYKDTKAAKAADGKAVANARALADAITPFYGKAASDQLFQLLAGHYGSIKEIMKSSYGGDARGKSAAMKKLTDNAEQIADFLDGANPNLPKATVLPLLMAHGGHHVQGIDAVNNSNFAEEAEVWDAMLSHIYAISDAMAGALAKQFPNKVSD